MGTSVSQRSPSTPSWRAVQAVYRAEIPVERVAFEVWRAALHDPTVRWQALLSSEPIQRCLDVASTSDSAQSAVYRASRMLAQSGSASIAAQLATRAVAQTAGTGDARAGFGPALFRQVTDYLIARDLSGYVGSRYRNTNVAESAAFKADVSRHVTKVVGAVPLESGDWPSYVRRVTRALRTSHGHEG